MRAADRAPPAPTSTSPTAVSSAGDLAAGHGAAVHDHAGQRGLHVVYLDLGAVAQPDHALVGELAAALGVERGAVEDELDVVALAGGRDADPADQQARGPATR